MKKNTLIPFTLGGIISIFALYLAFRNVPFSDLSNYLSSIDYLWIFPSVFTIFLSFILRAVRWRIILEPVGKIKFWHVFHTLMIGFMINCILPGRVGEIARPTILKKNDNIPFSTGLATVAAERVFDISLLIIFFMITLAIVRIDPALDISVGKYHLNKVVLVTAGGSVVKVLLLLIVGIIIVFFDKTRKWLNDIIIKFPYLFFWTGAEFKEQLVKKMCVPLINMIENFASGFTLIKKPSAIFLCTGLSFVIWLLLAVSYYIMALGCPGIKLSFFEMSAVMIIICFFIALPSVPGYWGIWEAGGIFAMALFGVATKDAAGFTLANHVIQIFPVIIVGFVSAMVTGINILNISRISRN